MKTSILSHLVIAPALVTLLSACGGRLTGNQVSLISQTPATKPTSQLANGSQIIICVDEKGAVKSAELLDLVEGKQREGLTPAPSTLDVSTQTAHLLDVIENGIGDRGEGPPAIRMKLQALAAPFLDPASKIRDHGPLALTETVANIKLDQGCSVHQLVRTESLNGATESTLDADLFAQLNATSQAAAIAHEALSGYLAQLGEVDSNRVRPFIAQIASGMSFPTRASQLTAPFVECTSGTKANSHLYISSSSANSQKQPTQIFVESIDGVPRLGVEPTTRPELMSDFTTGSTCVVDRILRVPLQQRSKVIGAPDRADMLYQVCYLGEVSLYVSRQNGDLAGLLKNGLAQKLTCVSKTTLAPTN